MQLRTAALDVLDYNMYNMNLNFVFQTVPRNYDPALHPFEGPREYSRALNAVKLERVFAKPFLGALEGHREGVYTMCKHPHRLALMLSGSYDGEVSSHGNRGKRSPQGTIDSHVFPV